MQGSWHEERHLDLWDHKASSPDGLQGDGAAPGRQRCHCPHCLAWNCRYAHTHLHCLLFPRVCLLLEYSCNCIACSVWLSFQYRHIHAFALYADFECLFVAVHERVTGPPEPLGLTSNYQFNSNSHSTGIVGPVDQLLHVRCISLSLATLNCKLAATGLLPDLQFWYSLKSAIHNAILRRHWHSWQAGLLQVPVLDHVAGL